MAKIQSKIIHFRRWSRKKYAVFSSLGCCVSIRHIDKSIAEASMKKQKSAALLSFSIAEQQNHFEREEENTGITDSLCLLLTSILQPCVSAESCGNRNSIFLLNRTICSRIDTSFCIYPAVSLYNAEQL